MFFISPLACLSWEFFWLPYFSTRMPSSIWKRNMGIFWRRKKISPWLQFLTTLSEIQLQYVLHQWSDGTSEWSIFLPDFFVFSYDYDDGINGTVLCWRLSRSWSKLLGEVANNLLFNSSNITRPVLIMMIMTMIAKIMKDHNCHDNNNDDDWEQWFEKCGGVVSFPGPSFPKSSKSRLSHRDIRTK